MPIGPVYWGSYPGELIEQVGAALLLQERPRAWHRKPSQGDGGVDVVEPIEGGYHVYQIKKFVDVLSSSDKAKIERSFNTMKTYPKLDQPVVHWSLVIPRNPSSENELWFRGFTKDAGFHCDWLGEVFWHSEAAKYPYVIDYYLGNGRERLEARVHTLVELLTDSGIPVRPVDVIQEIGDLHRELNASDPHYRYDFQVTGSSPAQRSVPTLVMTHTRRIEISTFVTVDVISRYGQALLDRPIAGSFSFRILDTEAGIDLRDAYQTHIDYGRAFEIPAQAVSMVALEAPGGLAEGLSEYENVEIRIGPRTPVNPEPLWIDVCIIAGQDGEAVESMLLSVSEQHYGERAIELKASDPSGLLNFECRLVEAGKGHREVEYHVRIGGLIGMPVKIAYGPYRFALNHHSPNTLRMILRNSFGTLFEGRKEITEATVANWETSLAYIEVLRELQRHTAVPLILSDRLSNDDLIDLHVARDLLSGQSIRSDWTKGSFTLPRASWNQAKAALEANHTIARIEPFSIPNGNSRVVLGLARQVLTNIVLASEEMLDDEHVKIFIEAGADSYLTETLFNPQTFTEASS